MCPQAERSSCDVLSIPVPIRRGGSESNLDVVDSVGDDGVGLDFTKGALGIDSLQQKILKVRGDTSHLLLDLFVDSPCLTWRVNMRTLGTNITRGLEIKLNTWLAQIVELCPLIQ